MPLQLPYQFTPHFKNNFVYQEDVIPACQEFLICLWSIKPNIYPNQSISLLIISDACIDLIVHPDKKEIAFSGMSQPNFCFKIPANTSYFGARLRPGAFHILTGLPATTAMDFFLPL